MTAIHAEQHDVITVVSGLPRSGTSMMMQILEAGGLAPLTDGVRQADRSNLRGYYEYERVKQLRSHDSAWLPEARGKAVKIISMLLPYLPSTYVYRVVFMRRAMHEVLRSQKALLIADGKPTDQASDDELAALYAQHLVFIERWLAQQPNITTITIDYNQVLTDPAAALTPLAQAADVLSLARMIAAVDASLYHQRTR